MLWRHAETVACHAEAGDGRYSSVWNHRADEHQGMKRVRYFSPAPSFRANVDKPLRKHEANYQSSLMDNNKRYVRYRLLHNMDDDEADAVIINMNCNDWRAVRPTLSTVI